MAEDFELGEWVQIRGYENGGPVQEVDDGGGTVAFMDIRSSKLLTVPRALLCRVGDRKHSPRPIQYEISALPVGRLNRRNHRLFLEARPGDRWSVTDGYSDRRHLGADGTWSHLDDQDWDAWKTRHWHSFSDAALLASIAADEMIADMPDRSRNARDPEASDGD